jgi:hypothetical protein
MARSWSKKEDRSMALLDVTGDTGNGGCVSDEIWPASQGQGRF